MLKMYSMRFSHHSKISATEVTYSIHVPFFLVDKQHIPFDSFSPKLTYTNPAYCLVFVFKTDACKKNHRKKAKMYTKHAKHGFKM